MHCHYRVWLRSERITWRSIITDGIRLLTSVSHGAAERNLKALVGEGRMLTRNGLPRACHDDEACDWSVTHLPEDYMGRTGSGSGNNCFGDELFINRPQEPMLIHGVEVFC